MMRRKINSLEKPLVIFIYGTPGARKSSTAVRLAAKLGIKVAIGTDQIRDILKLCLKNPFLEGPTHNRWQLIGQRTPENMVKGYLAQAELVKTAVLEVLKLAAYRGENMIIEGVHLFPGLYPELKDDQNVRFFHFLLSAGNENIHQKNIDLKIRLRHGREKDWPKEKIEEIREIQKFFLNNRPSYVHLIDFKTVQGKVGKIVEILKESL